jgi:hypothetical protein
MKKLIFYAILLIHGGIMSLPPATHMHFKALEKAVEKLDIDSVKSHIATIENEDVDTEAKIDGLSYILIHASAILAAESSPTFQNPLDSANFQGNGIVSLLGGIITAVCIAGATNQFEQADNIPPKAWIGLAGLFGVLSFGALSSCIHGLAENHKHECIRKAHTIVELILNSITALESRVDTGAGN